MYVALKRRGALRQVSGYLSLHVEEFLYFEKRFERVVIITLWQPAIMSSHVCRPEETRGFDVR